jgi:hypothetical protein
MIAQQQEVFAGAWGARATSSSLAASTYKQLSTSQFELYYRVRFKIINPGSNTLRLLRFQTATGSSIVGLYVNTGSRLGYTNYVAATNTNSTVVVSQGVWHEAQVRVLVNGASSQVEIWLDGARISALSRTDSLGTTAIGRVLLGDSSTGRSYDVAFDDVAVHTSFINP